MKVYLNHEDLIFTQVRKYYCQNVSMALKWIIENGKQILHTQGHLEKALPGSTDSAETQAYSQSWLQMHFSSVAEAKFLAPTLENEETVNGKVYAQNYYLISILIWGGAWAFW